MEGETWKHCRFNMNKEIEKKIKSMSMMWTEMSQITCDHPRLRVTSQPPMRNVCCHAAKLACAKLKLG